MSAMTIPPRLLQMLRPSEIYGLLVDSAKQWSGHRASSKGAALSLYMVFSLAPMLILVIAVAGIFFGEEAVRSELFAQRSEEHTSELQSRENLVCRLLLEKK